ncbi:MAG: hypothetical protein JNL79_03220 [Myxococcales bacterium]|nr:hypothetical protein [Myxococcales bacterium]
MRVALRALTVVAPIVVWAGTGCASRSSLASLKADASEDSALETDPDASRFDTTSEARTEEVAPGPACATRPGDCPIDDFGPRFALIKAYETCASAVASECGDLYLVFDAEGCLLEVKDIRDFSKAFVDCIIGHVGASRWMCGSNKTFRMYQACP